MTEEPFGYDTDGDGYIDTEDRGSFFGYDFDGDGDIDTDDDFYGFIMVEEADFCFIATAVYGDLNHPKVITLRRFRDRVLLNNSFGKTVIRWYYGIGRAAGKMIINRKCILRVTRLLLNGLTWLIAFMTLQKRKYDQLRNE
jgi:hypothetical protein